MGINMKMKKITSVLLSAAMILGLTACGNDSQEETGPEFVYVPEYISLPTGENASYDVVQMTNNKVYYAEWLWNEETGAGEEKYWSLDMSDSAAAPVELKVHILQDGLDVMQKQFDTEGNMYAGVRSHEQKEMTDDDGNTYMGSDYEHSKAALVKYLADGSEAWSADISGLLTNGEFSWLQSLVLDKDGNIYLSDGESGIWVFDGEGKQICSINISEWIQGMGLSKDGDVYVATYGTTENVLKKVDLTTKSLGPELTGLPGNSYEAPMPGIEKDFLLRTNNALYEYDMETRSSEKILSFLDADLTGDYVRQISTLADGRIAIYYTDWAANETEVIALAKKAASEVEQKEILTLATMSLPQEVQAAIVKFNKSNAQYRITVKDYFENMDNGENAWQDAINRLNNDLLTGSAPDLINLSSVNVQLMAAKGIFEDLTPYLEKSESLKREDLVESVLQAYTISDTLCAIPTTFDISTVMAPTAIVGEKMGWTLDEMLAAVNNMPEGAEIMEGASKNNILSMMMRYSAGDFMDWEKGKCNFDSEEFIKVLEFANQFPAEYNYDENAPSMPELAQSGRLLMVDHYLSSATDYQIIGTVWKQPMTCIGFPSSTGNGSTLLGNGAVAMNAKSKHKDAAWSFIEKFVSESGENDRFSWGFSTLKEAQDRKFEEDMTPNYMYDENGEIQYDENGNAMQYSKGGWSFGNSETYDIYAATQEEVDAVKYLIDHTTALQASDQQLFEIIAEEAAPFFDGQKSAAEAAEIIQNRIQIYVDESR